jgi:hypothetical protein
MLDRERSPACLVVRERRGVLHLVISRQPGLRRHTFHLGAAIEIALGDEVPEVPGPADG